MRLVVGDVTKLAREPVGSEIMLCETNPEMSDWLPVAPPVAPPDAAVWFVDGVQRQEVTMGLLEDDGSLLGLAGVGAVAAGATLIRRGHSARFAFFESLRVLCAPNLEIPMLTDLLRRGNLLDKMLPVEEGVEPFGSALGIQRQALEVDVVTKAQETGDFVLADGLYHGAHPRTAGMAKRHSRKYLTDRQYQIIGELGAGYRTPIFRLPGDKLSWYLRLERSIFGHWSGIVRLETSAPLEAAVELANLYSAVLPSLKSDHLTERRGTREPPTHRRVGKGTQTGTRRRTDGASGGERFSQAIQRLVTPSITPRLTYTGPSGPHLASPKSH